ncbi:type I methionyl aminopeptidase [Candidatus Peregrinibacteria bacterium CG10_big_fil_rev_8_21_14_0_10_49_16]|nr:MAG: type I methionyl aminopeptidase [Candidatus Peregrinibacteria bacterium CG22_combo_CG10-13_8_21_14_all_49_11]PIR51845.1 MAG: type I methionyl aminopeptidase [Candidatus Peregrinibacteria bacterium CG10_big_fil_rev_8_21_14_0_10_49_16]
MPDFETFNESQIESLKKGGKILRGCLDYVATLVEPGITTGELDMKAEEYICDHGAKPGFKGYRGFPATLCTSVNEECVHGIPGKRALVEGNIISIDCGVLLDQLYTDACITVGVGGVSTEAQDLINVSEEALAAAVGLIAQGVRIGDISACIEKVIRKGGAVPVKSLTGHGLGSTLHQFPDIPNWGTKGTGATLPPFTLIAVEPIVSLGDNDVKAADDGWTLSIADGALSAHSEHTILVIPEGNIVIA